MSLVRRALDRLLAEYPDSDVLRVEWQVPYRGSREDFGPLDGPWVLVDIGEPSATLERTIEWDVRKFAIWRATGDVYEVGPDGAVPDHPIIEGEG